MPPHKPFESMINKNGPYVDNLKSRCWIHFGSRAGRAGHARYFEFGEMYAHRVSWIRHIGPIPRGLLVLHKCDNPVCVNPTHLFLGTHKDNSSDMVSKERQAKGDRQPLHVKPELAARGEMNGSAKLTESIVRQIRRDWVLVPGSVKGAKGKFFREQAAKYGVGCETIRRVTDYLLWKHVRD